MEMNSRRQQGPQTYSWSCFNKNYFGKFIQFFFVDFVPLSLQTLSPSSIYHRQTDFIIQFRSQLQVPKFGWIPSRDFADLPPPLPNGKTPDIRSEFSKEPPFSLARSKAKDLPAPSKPRSSRLETIFSFLFTNISGLSEPSEISFKLLHSNAGRN